MELLRLKTAYCSGDDRNDLSHTLRNVVAMIVSTLPADTFLLGKVFPNSRSQANDADATWWLLGYNFKYHMVFAQAVSGRHPAHIMRANTLLRTVEGAVCEFDSNDWRAAVTTAKLFYELGIDKLTDEAVVSSFLSYPPERFSITLGYSLFRLENERELLLPCTSEWVELELLAGVNFIDIPDGIKHVAITSSISDTTVRLPDSIISCYIHRDVSVRLSIPKRFSKHWGYWSAIWGKSYTIKDGFSCTPDGLVSVRP